MDLPILVTSISFVISQLVEGIKPAVKAKFPEQAGAITRTLTILLTILIWFLSSELLAYADMLPAESKYPLLIALLPAVGVWHQIDSRRRSLKEK